MLLSDSEKLELFFKKQKVQYYDSQPSYFTLSIHWPFWSVSQLQSGRGKYELLHQTGKINAPDLTMLLFSSLCTSDIGDLLPLSSRLIFL
jgi:hypothetical protein